MTWVPPARKSKQTTLSKVSCRFDLLVRRTHHMFALCSQTKFRFKQKADSSLANPLDDCWSSYLNTEMTSSRMIVDIGRLPYALGKIVVRGIFFIYSVRKPGLIRFDPIAPCYITLRQHNPKPCDCYPSLQRKCPPNGLPTRSCMWSVGEGTFMMDLLWYPLPMSHFSCHLQYPDKKLPSISFLSLTNHDRVTCWRNNWGRLECRRNDDDNESFFKSTGVWILIAFLILAVVLACVGLLW